MRREQKFGDSKEERRRVSLTMKNIWSDTNNNNSNNNNEEEEEEEDDK